MSGVRRTRRKASARRKSNALTLAESVLKLRQAAFQGQYEDALHTMTELGVSESDAIEVLKGYSTISGDGGLLQVKPEAPEIRAAFHRYVLKAADVHWRSFPPWGDEFLDHLYDEADASRLRAIEEIRKSVVDFADNDKEYPWVSHTYMDTDTDKTITLSIPGRALACYALSSARAWHLMPAYEPFAPTGLKMMLDNPYHSDAYLGAGLECDETGAFKHFTPNDRALFDAMAKVQRVLTGFEFAVLARGARAKRFLDGIAWHPGKECPKEKGKVPVLILPHAGVEFDAYARKAKCVISETGGRLSHLAVVSRERGIPLLMLEGAVTKFPQGTRFYIDLVDGTLSAYYSNVPRFRDDTE